jgi:hypothetical protein
VCTREPNRRERSSKDRVLKEFNRSSRRQIFSDNIRYAQILSILFSCDQFISSHLIQFSAHFLSSRRQRKFGVLFLISFLISVLSVLSSHRSTEERKNENRSKTKVCWIILDWWSVICWLAIAGPKLVSCDLDSGNRLDSVSPYPLPRKTEGTDWQAITIR